MSHRPTRAATLLAAVLLLAASACGDSDDPASDSDTGDSGTDQQADQSSGSDSCPSEPFSGTVSSTGDDNNEAFELTDGDVTTTQAVALVEGQQYTVYLADYDLAGQAVGIDTVEADQGQVVVTMQARSDDGGEIEPGVTYSEDFVILDSGGGAQGAPDDPIGSVTFIAATDDHICFAVDYVDTGAGHVVQGTVSADVISAFGAGD
jgi:hypothetical protein